MQHTKEENISFPSEQKQIAIKRQNLLRLLKIEIFQKEKSISYPHIILLTSKINTDGDLG